ncbi:MAG: MFS transporter [Pseudomonadota bacterium]
MSEAIPTGIAIAPEAGTKRVFAWLWLSQLISVTGSSLTGFAAGVWVFQQTGSVLDYALLVACAAAPALVVAPWAGAWVDRMDRRWVMIAARSGAAVCTATIGLLLWLVRLEIWQVLPLYALAVICEAFQRPAFLAAVTTVLPKERLARASGMTQLGYAIPLLIAPLLAAVLLGMIGLGGVIALDLTCFAISTVMLLPLRFPQPIARQRPRSDRRSSLKEFGEALAFIGQRRSLKLQLAYFALEKFLTSMAVVLFTPFVLAMYSAPALGTILTVGGLGMLTGSLVMSAWGGPPRRVLGILVFDMLLGTAVLVGGMWTSIPLLTACAFVVMFCRPIIAGCDQTIWQLKVSPALHGRVFALRNFLVTAAVPLAAIVAGLVTEHSFKPWMMPGGLLADSAGAWLGVGPGRGVGLMFVAVGLLIIAMAGAAMLHPAFRQLENKVPDAH